MMAGIADAAQYFPTGQRLRVSIDCQDDQAWDVCLSMSINQGTG